MLWCLVYDGRDKGSIAISPLGKSLITNLMLKRHTVQVHAGSLVVVALSLAIDLPCIAAVLVYIERGEDTIGTAAVHYYTCPR